MADKFKAGDVVRLKSGGPIMTVQWATSEQVRAVRTDKDGDL